MTLRQKINALEKLGAVLLQAGQKKGKLAEFAASSSIYNGWFTEENVLHVFTEWGKSLVPEQLSRWLEPYSAESYSLEPESPVTIGLIMAGNIPLAGFHDLLCVLLSGHNALVKASGDDEKLPRLICEILISIEPGFKKQIQFTEGRLAKIDAIIATGSSNSSRYFDFYFGKYPHIIRKNRNSAAVLSGSESRQQMQLLGKDVFQYFGLGCRSISKLFVPEGYDFDLFFGGIFDYKNIINHNKYANNYEYNKTVYLMQGINLIENGFLLLKEDIGLSSPVAVLFYEYYSNATELNQRLQMDSGNIQCLVSGMDNVSRKVEFGSAQSPELWDYADGVDTLKFLQNLRKQPVF